MGKVILITGAASGIGYASAKMLIEEGHIVYGGDIQVGGMRSLEEIGATPLLMDVTDEVSVKAGVARIIEEQGRLDVLFANAGYMLLGMFECVEIEDAQTQFEVNVFGVARTVKAVLPQMREQASGTIIIASSVVGKVPVPGMGWYPASKHAVEALADALRMEVKRFGINVVLIEPGFVNTKLLGASFPTLDKAEQSSVANVYQTDHKNFRANLTKGFETSSTVETITRVVSKAVKATKPKRRYRPNFEARVGIFLKEKIGDGLLDIISTRMWLK